MTHNQRPHGPIDHRKIVDLCLHVAATNTELLALRADGQDVLASDLNPLGCSIRMTAASALRSTAQHVDTFAAITARNIGEQLTAPEEIAKVEQVRAIGRELAALADRTVVQKVVFAEFEDIRVRSMDLGFALKPHHALDVVLAVADR